MNPQHPSTLPSGWESDYDGTSERWFFVHRPTGYSQFFFPKAGDENSRIAELAQPQPMNGTNSSLTIKMEAMTVSENTNNAVPDPQPALAQTMQPNSQQQQQQQGPPPVQPPSTPQASSVAQQIPNQRSPLARSVSGTIQRKLIQRRDSVPSQASATSSQAAPLPTQQSPVLNLQTLSSTNQMMQNVQSMQQVPKYQQPQAILQSGSTQPAPLQAQQYQQHQASLQNGSMQPALMQALPPQLFYQNQQPLLPQAQQQYQIQPAQIQTGMPTQTQIHQATTQTVQYQQVPPLQTITGQPVQHHVHQPSLQSPQTITLSSQPHPQSGHARMQQQHQQQKQSANPQMQPYHPTPLFQNQIPQQTLATNQRRFSTIPVSHQSGNGQISNPLPQPNQFQGPRHSSIGTDNYQSPPLIQQMQSVPGQTGQPTHFVPVPQTYAPQLPQQGSPMIQSSSGVHYIQQNVAPLPPSLPPPAPGMQWVLVQPGNQQPQILPPQPAPNPNQSSQFSVQVQQLQGGAQLVERPGLVTRLSSSTMSGSKKAFEASKGFVKKHPGKSMAIMGGLGIVAEACGVSVISDAVAGSKVYANVQNAKARRKAVLSATAASAHTPTQQAPQVAHHISNPTPNGNTPGVQYVIPQVTYQAPQVLYQQSTAPHMANMVNGNTTGHAASQQGVMNSQPIFIPTHQALYQQASHPQFIPINFQHQHQYHVPHLPQQFSSQQNPRWTDQSAQFIQNQNSQLPNNGQQQQNPVQYYQPLDGSQFQNQQLDPSQIYVVQDSSGQNNQGSSGGLMDCAADTYNMLSGGQGNSPTQSQPPSPSNTGIQSSPQQQQILTPSASPFDASSQIQQFPSSSTPPFDSSSQQPQFTNVSPSVLSFDPSAQLQQSPTPSASPSQQLDGGMVGQSILNTSIQDDNSYIASSSPFQDVTPNLPGQSMLNDSVLDDNSYIDAPPSPTLVDSGSNCGDYDALAQGFADQDSAIF